MNLIAPKEIVHIKSQHMDREKPPLPDWGQPTGAMQPSVQEAHNVDIARRINSLESKIEKIVEAFTVANIVANTLANDKWKLRCPINVAVENRGLNDFVACLYDIDLYGYGETVPEALDDLKSAIINQYLFLKEQTDSVELSSPLNKQLAFLNDIIVEQNVK